MLRLKKKLKNPKSDYIHIVRILSDTNTENNTIGKLRRIYSDEAFPSINSTHLKHICTFITKD